jgi:putative FmdB family regulatory protein
MPKYEYACKSCGEHVEVVQSFADAPLTECPACGGPLRKVFSPPGIAFKGSGFYRTDNRKRRTEPKVDGAKADGAKADGAKSDSKAGSGGDSGGDSGGSKSGDSSGGAGKSESAPAAESKPKATEAKTA